jgi:hypothetical protein
MERYCISSLVITWGSTWNKKYPVEMISKKAICTLLVKGEMIRWTDRKIPKNLRRDMVETRQSTKNY